MASIAPVLVSGILNGTLTTTSATVASDKTLTPEGFTKGGIATYRDLTAANALGATKMTMSLRPPTKEIRVYKASMKLSLPTLETVDPATGIFGPVLAYALEAHVDVLMHERSTSAERLVLLNTLASLFSTTIQASDGSPTGSVASPMVDAIKDLASPY